MQFVNKVIKANLFYVFISFFSASTSFILIPLYVSNFTVSQYGVFALLNSFFSIVTIFISLNLSSAAQTFYFDYQNNKHELAAYFKNIFSFALFISIGCALLLMLAGPYVFDFYFTAGTILFYPNGAIVVFSALFITLNQIYFVLLRNSENFSKYAYIMLSATISNVILQVVLIKFLNIGISGALFGALLSNLFIFLYIVSTNNLIHFKINFALLKKSITYSLWLLPFLFMQWFLAKGDRFLIEHYISLQQVGIYALLMNISMVISLLATSLLNGIRPGLFAEFKKTLGWQNPKLAFYGLFYAFAILGAASVVYVFVQNIEYFQWAKSYISIKNYIFLALLLFVIRVAIRFFNEYLSYHKKSNELTFFAVINFMVFMFLFLHIKNDLSLTSLLQILIISNSILLILVTGRCINLITAIKTKSNGR